MIKNIILLFVILLWSTVVSAQHLDDFIYTSDINTAVSSTANGLGYQIYQMQVLLWQNQLSGESFLIQDDVLLLLSDLRSLASYSILDAMQYQPDKESFFDEKVSELESALYRTNAIQLQLESESTLLSSEISSCSTQKKLSDKAYAHAIGQSNSIESVDPMIISSQQNASCIADKSALLSAKSQMFDNLSYWGWLIADKYDYLLSNRDIILNHFDLLKSDYLSDVLNVQKSINNKKY